jgi:hypothetical protein
MSRRRPEANQKKTGQKRGNFTCFFSGTQTGRVKQYGTDLSLMNPRIAPLSFLAGYSKNLVMCMKKGVS